MDFSGIVGKSLKVDPLWYCKEEFYGSFFGIVLNFRIFFGIVA